MTNVVSETLNYKPQRGDLLVWYIPQIPMAPFQVIVPVDDDAMSTAVALLDTIINFSIFEYENRVKPDYSDAGGISRWEDDGEGGYGWCDVDEYEYRDDL